MRHNYWFDDLIYEEKDGLIHLICGRKTMKPSRQTWFKSAVIETEPDGAVTIYAQERRTGFNAQLHGRDDYEPEEVCRGDRELVERTGLALSRRFPFLKRKKRSYWKIKSGWVWLNRAMSDIVINVHRDKIVWKYVK